MNEDSCIFCRIVSGEIPAYKVYEDQDVLAFLDLHPVNPGHTLVIPKEHTEFFEEMGGDRYQHVMDVVHVVARMVKKEFKPVRVGLMAWGFEVPHTHFHVVPLNKAEEFGMKRDVVAEASEAELAAAAKRLTQYR